MNDCRRLGRAKSRRYDDAVGQGCLKFT